MIEYQKCTWIENVKCVRLMYPVGDEMYDSIAKNKLVIALSKKIQ